jgi:hypothetical protein
VTTTTTMADARLVLSDPLCFLFSKFGKTDVKQIRSILLEYYSAVDIAAAKKQLVDDVLKMDITKKTATHATTKRR